ncbi:MAG: hypothetical protein IPQ05_18420 [Leptospiraceae bacterium]|nr:hypothetical protein [Leptospiraceae bacterium]
MRKGMTKEEIKDLFKKHKGLRTIKISKGAEEIELTEEDDEILDRIWDERGRREREEKMKEQEKK